VVSGALRGKVWEAIGRVRIGREDTLEVVLDDNSVSRRHAEIRPSPSGWRIADLKSTNGIRVNGHQVGQSQWPLRVRDLLTFGDVDIVVEALEDGAAEASAEIEQGNVEAVASATWEEALGGLAFDVHSLPRPGDQLQALLRAGHHLVGIDNEEEFLQSILDDAVRVLDAQRGAIVLLDGPDGTPRLRAVRTGRGEPRAMVTGRLDPASRHCYSQSLAQRCVTRGESLLWHSANDDPEMSTARSIAEGTMASVLCVLLRTPRKLLGVLHLDRSPWQGPFTRDDLHLADALAASVSAGIEMAQLLRKQQDVYMSTITILAQTVELRDAYTGGHTGRVRNYSLLLGEQLGLSPAELKLIERGTPLHDIGKIGIKDAILSKEGPLTTDEFEEMKKHTIKGAEILETIPELHEVIPIVRSHHERWDGKGYPDGLVGEEIPKLARIVAVADAFDAMTSDRPYRKGRPADVAFAEVERMAGLQFDPRCATAFVAIKDLVVQEMRSHATTVVARPAARPPCRYSLAGVKDSAG
jgi:putative nucleotidyltransferase with HDIG domain